MSGRSVTLSDSEFALLDYLTTHVDRGEKKYKPLERYGFAQIGVGKFGSYARITAEGRVYWNKAINSGRKAIALDPFEQVGASDGVPEAGCHAPASVLRAGQAESRKRRQRPKAAAVSSSAGPSCPPLASPLKNGGNTPLRPTAAAAANSQKPRASGLIPNACRVIVGKSVTYYPPSAFDKIRHGEKAYVFTVNKHFRQYPLAASTGDTEVPAVD